MMQTHGAAATYVGSRWICYEPCSIAMPHHNHSLHFTVYPMETCWMVLQKTSSEESKQASSVSLWLRTLKSSVHSDAVEARAVE